MKGALKHTHTARRVPPVVVGEGQKEAAVVARAQLLLAVGTRRQHLMVLCLETGNGGGKATAVAQ